MYGIEGSTLEVGDALTPEVARAVETVAASIRDEILDAAPAPP